jgi:uncharacterized protein YbjT (DUF2867 family)
MSQAVLVTGATGYVGGRLVDALLEREARVRCLARRPEALDGKGVEAVQGDVVSGAGLEEALAGIRTAYYLVHSMGRGSGARSDFAERDRRAARNFADAARAAGVERVVYLGGLEAATGPGASEHLKSRHEVAEILRDRGPDLVYARAAMVIGAGSASFAMLEALVRRLPVMVCPRWIDTQTQPIAVRDVVRSLCEAAELPVGNFELELGGADTLSYRDMMSRLAGLLGRRAPAIVRVPVLTPRLSSYWVALITPVEAGLALPLIDGLSEEMVVRTPPPHGINADPAGFEEAARAALAEERS